MKCEKQRHQGEEYSSKPNREDQCFQPTHNWLLGTGAGGAAPQPLRVLPAGWPMDCASQPTPTGTAQLGPEVSDEVLIHSHTMCPAQNSCSINCAEYVMNVLPGNYLAPTERPLTEIPSHSSLLGQDRALVDSSSKVPPCTLKTMPKGHPLDSCRPYTALALALTTLCPNCLGVCLSLA